MTSWFVRNGSRREWVAVLVIWSVLFAVGCGTVLLINKSALGFLAYAESGKAGPYAKAQILYAEGERYAEVALDKIDKANRSADHLAVLSATDPDIVRAEKALRAALIVDPRGEFSVSLVGYYEALGAMAEATSRPVERLTAQAAAALARGDVVSAKQDAAAALALNPKSDAAYRALAEVARRARQWPELAAIAQQMETHGASAAQTAEFRAEAAYAQERYADAVELWKKALELQPIRPQDTRLGLARALLGAGKTEEAVAVLVDVPDEITRRDPGHLHRTGYYLLEAKRPVEAATVLARALKLSPANSDIMATLAQALYRSGRQAEGVRMLQRATGLDPKLSRIDLAGQADPSVVAGDKARDWTRKPK